MNARITALRVTASRCVWGALLVALVGCGSVETTTSEGPRPREHVYPGGLDELPALPAATFLTERAVTDRAERAERAPRSRARDPEEDTDPRRDVVDAAFPAEASTTSTFLGARGRVQEDLGEGEYLFLPNRRSIWVVNRSVGRFANYDFRDHQDATVKRSRVVTLDPNDFPARDTVYHLSDRNLTAVLWVCNERTGDVQLWVLRGNGEVKSEGHIVTSIDLLRSAK
ncbi:MAG: hypothetical protein O7J95_09720 [Planctomycetota bacterium]|nr:hypothetical protein [Planctomycetota bacterium]